MSIRSILGDLARRRGLDLLGVVPAGVLAGAPDVNFFHTWLGAGYHAGLAYLEGERAAIRASLDRLLPGTRAVLVAAINYNAPLPRSTALPDSTRAWISRYAWGDDYHRLLRQKLEGLVADLRERLMAEKEARFEARVCVDTSPVLERALARHSAAGWLGKNTCVINQKLGSWLFLGEVLTTLDIEPGEMDSPAADRCGSCTRCLEACPTQAFVAPRVLDSRRCISYWTIEEKGPVPETMRPALGRHVFGCDICQDVCPWNRRAPETTERAFHPREGLFNPPLEELARITEADFGRMFSGSTIRRAKYRGFMRNVCMAMGNAGEPRFIVELERLAGHSDALVGEHARWALAQLRAKETAHAAHAGAVV